MDKLPRLRAWLAAFLPGPVAVDVRERLRAILGVVLGIAVAGMLSRWASGAAGGGAWLVGPIGASAVLVFAAPASPLAQPWSVVAGNTVSVAIGLACAQWIPDTVLAAALAVALATIAMFSLRCLHPPGGAVAMLAVLAHAAGSSLPAGTVLLNSLLLVGAGLAYNPLTGRRYPHPQAPPQAAVPGARFRPEDIDAALAHYNQVLDVSRDDLEDLLQAAELEAYRRQAGTIRCQDIMSGEVASIGPGADLTQAWGLMRTRGIKALPVVDEARRIIGILTMADFLRATVPNSPEDPDPAPGAILHPGAPDRSDVARPVTQVMTRTVATVGQDRHAAELLTLFAQSGHHHIPVVDGENRLVGIITQSDFVRALYQGG